MDKRKSKNKERERPLDAAVASLAISTVLMVAILGFCAYDSPRYRSESVAAVLTHTPPKKEEPPGLWEIVADALEGIFG